MCAIGEELMADLKLRLCENMRTIVWPDSAFCFQDLPQFRVAAACEVPPRWLTLRNDLARAGVPPSSVRTLPDRPMADNVGAFLRGEIDVIQMLEPWADRLVKSGAEHVWHRFSQRGDIAYSTFYALRSYIVANRDACRRLVSGLAAAQVAFQAAPPAAIAESIGAWLPDLAAPPIARIIEGCREAQLWATTPDLPLESFVRLKAAMVSGGLLGRDVAYPHVVDAPLSSADPA